MSFLVLTLFLINILSAFGLVIPKNNNVKRDLVKKGISAEILLFIGAGVLVLFVIIVLCCCRMIRGNPDDDDEPIESKETIKITKTQDSGKPQTSDNSNSTLNVSESNLNNNNENDISQVSLNYSNDSYNNLNNSIGYNNYNPNQMPLNRPVNMPMPVNMPGNMPGNMPVNMPVNMPIPVNNNQSFGYSNNQYSGNINMNNNNSSLGRPNNFNNNPSLGRQNNFNNNPSLGRQNNFNNININNSQNSMNFMNINNQTGFGPSNQPNPNNTQNSVQNIPNVSIDEMHSSLGRNDNAGHSTIPKSSSNEKRSSGQINAPKIEEDPLPRYQTINPDKKHSEKQSSPDQSNNYISERAKRTGKAPMQDSPKNEKGKFVPSHSIMVKNFQLKPIKLN